jgi:hypothetical protein
LSADSFTITRNGGAPVGLWAADKSAGWYGSAVLAGLRPGDAVRLKERTGDRTITTLHVDDVHGFDLDVDNTGETIVCHPGSVFGTAPGLWFPCPAGRTFPYSPSGGAKFSIPPPEDDLSGGLTTATPPLVGNLTPAAGSNVDAGDITLAAEVEGGSSAAETLAEIRSASVVVSRSGASEPILDQTMTPTRSAGVVKEAARARLSPGYYTMRIAIVDINGDLAGYSETFHVIPAPPPPSQPKGTVRCSAAKRSTQAVCAAVIHAPGAQRVKVQITRKKVIFASGRAVVRKGIAHVKLRCLRALEHGRYTVTITAIARRGVATSRSIRTF